MERPYSHGQCTLEMILILILLTTFIIAAQELGRSTSRLMHRVVLSKGTK